MRSTAVFPLSFCVAAVVCAPAQAQESDSISQAKAAASSWLALVDAGNYPASWQQAANLFQTAVTEQSWASAAQASRAPLGIIKSRQVESITYTRALPGAPEGEYIVIKYTSQFSGKGNAIETVTPLKEKDGSWRVSGYFVR